MKTEPFDLQKALDGHPLVTRDGLPAIGFHSIPAGEPESQFPFAADVCGTIFSFRNDGRFISERSDNTKDLFMLIEEGKDAVAAPVVPGAIPVAVVEGQRFSDINDAYKFAREQAAKNPDKTIYVYELSKAFKAKITVEEQYEWEIKQ